MPLPSEFRAFLARYGACGFRGNASVVTDTGCFPVLVLYGRGSDAGSLLKALELHPDLQEVGALPIADDLFGDIYVLDVAEGGVFRLDYSTGSAEATRVADTFGAFLGSISVVPWE